MILSGNDMKTLLKTLFLSLMLASTHAYADVVDTLKQFNNDTNGLSGSFTQTVVSKKKKQTSSGSFQILRPNLFKWEYKRPYTQVVIGDGKHVWLYDVELKQVNKSDQKRSIDDSPAAILSNKVALESNYQLSADGKSGDIEWVLAKPKTHRSAYLSIRIGFKNQSLAAMELVDTFGNQTTIHFNHLNHNPNLSRGHFQFTPPTGVDVFTQ